MNTFSKILFVLLLNLGIHSAAQAQSFAELGRKADAISENLKEDRSFNKSDISQNAEEIHAHFKAAVDFMIEVTHDSNLTKAQKVDLIVQVSEDAGDFFVELTRPYEDMNPYPYQPLAGASKAKNFIRSIIPSTTFFFAGMYRDLATLFQGRALPITGEDYQRTKLINKMGKDIEQLYLQSASAATTEEGKLGLGATLKLLEDINPSEVMINGRYHRNVRRALFALGVLTFFRPPVEMFFGLAFERTTFSPLMAGFDWFLIMQTLRGIRGVNSGASFSSNMRSISNKIAQLEFKAGDNCSFGLHKRGE